MLKTQEELVVLKKMKPTWQKARVLLDNPYTHGKEVWVKVGPPTPKWAPQVDFQGNPRGPVEKIMAYDTNVQFPNGRTGVVSAIHMELLSRSPDDFADHVELEQYTDWLGYKQPNGGMADTAG